MHPIECIDFSLQMLLNPYEWKSSRIRDYSQIRKRKCGKLPPEIDKIDEFDPFGRVLSSLSLHFVELVKANEVRSQIIWRLWFKKVINIGNKTILVPLFGRFLLIFFIPSLISTPPFSDYNLNLIIMKEDYLRSICYQLVPKSIWRIENSVKQI